MKSNLTSEQEREFVVEILVYPTDLRHDWFQKPNFGKNWN